MARDRFVVVAVARTLGVRVLAKVRERMHQRPLHRREQRDGDDQEKAIAHPGVEQAGATWPVPLR